jgi:hypothetical protein
LQTGLPAKELSPASEGKKGKEMTAKNVVEAIRLSRQFVRTAELLIIQENALQKKYDRIYASKLSGQTRRHSMDLTRALAELRGAK